MVGSRNDRVDLIQIRESLLMMKSNLDTVRLHMASLRGRPWNDVMRSISATCEDTLFKCGDLMERQAKKLKEIRERLESPSGQ